jgi:hypothetical protein
MSILIIRRKDANKNEGENQISILTCTPVMGGRGDVKDTSPIMISRHISHSGYAAGNKLPIPFSNKVNTFYRDDIKMSDALKKYAMLSSEQLNMECDYQNDMEEGAQVSLKDSVVTNDKNYLIFSKKARTQKSMIS